MVNGEDIHEVLSKLER